MNIVDVMDQVATRLDTIPGLRVTAYPADNPQIPAAVVMYPQIAFDGSMVRGMDELSLEVLVLVARTPDRVARTAIAPYCHGSGASSIKQVLESGTYSAFHTLRVVSVEIGPTTYAGTDSYLGANFTLEITGQGA